MKKAFLLCTAMLCSLVSMATDWVTATYSSSKIDVSLTNNTPFVAFQMDIKVSGDITEVLSVNSERLTQVGTATIGGSTVNAPFVLQSNVLSDGTLRVLAYNLANRAISLNEGTLFTVGLHGQPSRVNVSNVIFVTADQLTEVEVQATAIPEERPTALATDQSTATAAPSYDLQGRSLRREPSSQHSATHHLVITRGKKTISR